MLMQPEQHKTIPGTSFQPEGREVRAFLPHLPAFGPESTEPSAASRRDPDAESNNFTPISESVSRSAVPRPKQAYNPLAAEQGRQRQLVEGKRPLASDIELQQSHRSRDNFFQATSTSTSRPAAEQVAVSTASVSAEPVLPLVFPCLYQVVGFDSTWRDFCGPLLCIVICVQLVCFPPGCSSYFLTQ